MGFRFRRSFRVMPGLRVNLSKSGVSESVGTRGAWLTFGKRGARATVGLPGTGLSYTESVGAPRQLAATDAEDGAGGLAGFGRLLVGIAVVVAVIVSLVGLGWLVGR